MQVVPLVEKDTFTDLLKDSVRLDGRSFHEFRDVRFRFPAGASKDGGACLASIGGTTVLATISLDVVEPRNARPTQGLLHISFDLRKLNHVLGRKGPRRYEDEGRRLSNILQNCLRDSLDLNNLCIVAWESVFAIKIELSVVSCDGNLADVGALSAVVALMTYKRPDIYVNSSGNVCVDYEERIRPKIPLQLIRMPVLVTLGLTHSIILVDPTLREESHLTTGRVIVGMTEFEEVCCLFTTGVQSKINPLDLDDCVKIASMKAKGLVALLRRVIEGYEKYRSALLAAKKGRQSEISKAKDSLDACPVVLSSADFIEFEDNEARNLEQGEIILEPQEIMISDEEIEPSTKEKVLNETDKISPYGFVELGTLDLDSNKIKRDQPKRKKKKILDEEEVIIL